MLHYDQFRTRELIDGLDLGPANVELAELWLSLWDAGKLPVRGAINPGHFRRFLPGLALLDFHPDDSVRFRLAGQGFRAAYGFDPSHHDMIALTPKADRAQRIARCRAIVQGTISTGMRHASDKTGAVFALSQDVILPLGGINEDGSRSWVFHTAWRPGRRDWLGAMPEKALSIAENYVERALI